MHLVRTNPPHPIRGLSHLGFASAAQTERKKNKINRNFMADKR